MSAFHGVATLTVYYRATPVRYCVSAQRSPASSNGGAGYLAGARRRGAGQVGILIVRRTEMTTVDQFVSSAREHLKGKDLLHLSGEVLYSAASTLRPGAVYLLGHNPGGDEQNVELPTVGTSLDGLPSQTWNSYIDTQWAGRGGKKYAAGEAPLQLRVKWLLEKLGLDPRDVAASNLIFPRSRDAASSRFLELSKICWPVHADVLQIVRPQMVIVYGNSGLSPYRFLLDMFEPDSEECQPSGHGAWLCRSFVVPDRFRVVGIPHMSRYKISAHDDVANWVRGLSKPTHAA